jgi:hypothetical protein
MWGGSCDFSCPPPPRQLLQTSPDSSPAELAARNGYTSLAEHLQGVAKGTISRPTRPDAEPQEQPAADLAQQEREAVEAALKPGFAGAGTEGTVMGRCGEAAAACIVSLLEHALASPCKLITKLMPAQATTGSAAANLGASRRRQLAVLQPCLQGCARLSCPCRHCSAAARRLPGLAVCAHAQHWLALLLQVREGRRGTKGGTALPHGPIRIRDMDHASLQVGHSYLHIHTVALPWPAAFHSSSVSSWLL